MQEPWIELTYACASSTRPKNVVVFDIHVILEDWTGTRTPWCGMVELSLMSLDAMAVVEVTAMVRASNPQ